MKKSVLAYNLFFLLMAAILVCSCHKTTEPNVVADPVFDPPAGDYAQDPLVALSCVTAGAEIRYTVDGSEPGEASALYEAPLALERGTLVKAQARKTGWEPSAVVSAFYSGITPTPTISLVSGEYEAGQSVVLHIDPTGLEWEHLKVRYTLDGSVPTDSSSIFQGQILLGESCTLNARGFYKNWNPSPVVSAQYTIITPTVEAPVIDPISGSYNIPLGVTIACPTPFATIRYTSNGNDPTETSPVYNGPLTFAATGPLTVKAKAFREYQNPSSITVAEYVLNWPPPDMAYVSSGTFYNGTANVTLSSFYLAKNELTQSEYLGLMGTNPAQGHGVGDLYPVYSVTWFKAIEYCNRRSLLEGFEPCYSYSSYGSDPDDWPFNWDQSPTQHTLVSCDWTANGYRLPTEMEWMFAALGGVNSHGYTYSGSNNIDSVAWYNGNSGNATHTIGSKDPNELGIFDLSGNVAEWVWDIHNAYPDYPQTDPHGPETGYLRVIRGGSYGSPAVGCAVTARLYNNATANSALFGLRLCRRAN